MLYVIECIGEFTGWKHKNFHPNKSLNADGYSRQRKWLEGSEAIWMY